MQFHLNTLKPDDCHASDLFAGVIQRDDAVPAQVDMPIVDCGPAGLILAAQLAAIPNIRVCIVERKDGPLQRGQADGVASRTMEMFEALNFSERCSRKPAGSKEVNFWRPDARDPGKIVRHVCLQDLEDGLAVPPAALFCRDDSAIRLVGGDMGSFHP